MEMGYRVRVNSVLKKDESRDNGKRMKCSYLWNCGGLFEERSRRVERSV